MSTKSRCNKIRAFTGVNHTRALQLLKMFNVEILALQRKVPMEWEDAAKRVLVETGLCEEKKS